MAEKWRILQWETWHFTYKSGIIIRSFARFFITGGDDKAFLTSHSAIEQDVFHLTLCNVYVTGALHIVIVVGPVALTKIGHWISNSFGVSIRRTATALAKAWRTMARGNRKQDVKGKAQRRKRIYKPDDSGISTV